jgi:hypothetical protein
MNSIFTPRPQLNLARVAARYAARREATLKESFKDAGAQQELLETISATSETRERANEALGVSTKTIEAPVPTETPVEKPNVWEMPTTGSGMCDCGQSHDLDTDWLLDCAFESVEDPEWMTHKEVIRTAKMFWEYESICEFFRMAINVSATAVNGQPAEKYKFEVGIEIVAHFSKTWNGCPEEACQGDEEED